MGKIFQNIWVDFNITSMLSLKMEAEVLKYKEDIKTGINWSDATITEGMLVETGRG